MPKVWFTCIEDYVLILRQRMEHRPDVTIEVSIVDVGFVLIHLDSPQFPEQWHGCEVTMDFDPSEKGGIRFSKSR